MNAVARPTTTVEAEADAAPIALLRTLVVCDLVDSTKLVGAIGDRGAADLFRKHDRMARAMLATHRGREIDKTDGFLLMFDRPVQAVAFALDYLRELRALGDAEQTALAARVGIHVGEVVAWDNSAADIARGAKPLEVEGLTKALAARLMQLALPNQILMSGVAHAFAFRAQGELGECVDALRWRTHGRYRFRGVPDVQAVFEVGEEGLAPLKAPAWSGKAHREMPFWRRPLVLGLELLVVFAMLLVPAWYLLRPESAIAFAQRDWVVVGDLANLTGDVRFDDAVDTAFRVGLEQSRYVNVLSGLKARETIARMQREPTTTRIDRAVGAEIALRDGARALILPTVAEVGGRVRVTVEVVDPHTQTTVWSGSVDGRGAESVLPSLDQLNRQLRLRLGEALASVKEASQPLQNVTTASLDALRAYSLAKREHARGEFDAAGSLYRMAIDLDPGFALAHAGQGLLLSNLGRDDQAKDAYRRALSFADRLGTRDAAYVQALLADHGVPGAALAQWRRLTAMYPDYFPGQGARAMAEYQLANDYEQALVSARKGADAKNANASAALHLVGILELGQERYAEALSAFDAASIRTVTHFHAATFAAQREFAKARAVLGAVGAADFGGSLYGASFEADQGRVAAALQTMQAMSGRASWTKDESRGITISMLGLRVAIGEAGSAAFYRAHAAAFAGDEARDDRLAAAFLLARGGEPALARELLASVPIPDPPADWPVRFNLYRLAAAELALRGGDAARAASLLADLPAATALYARHATALEVAAAAGARDKALEEARWLAAHRGRAYTETATEWALVPFNVATSVLAQLRQAELAQAGGDHDQARVYLQRFRAMWPAAADIPTLAERLRKLEPGSASVTREGQEPARQKPSGS